MAIVQEFNRRSEYVLKTDRSKPLLDRTVFTLRLLPARARRELIRTNLVSHIAQPPQGPLSPEQFAAYELITRFGVLSWDTLYRESGDPISFHSGHDRHDQGETALSETALDWLLPWYAELGEEIVRMSGLRPAKGGDAR